MTESEFVVTNVDMTVHEMIAWLQTYQAMYGKYTPVVYWARINEGGDMAERPAGVVIDRADDNSNQIVIKITEDKGVTR